MMNDDLNMFQNQIPDVDTSTDDQNYVNNQYKMDVFVDDNVNDCISMYGPHLKESLMSELRKNLSDNQLWISKRMGRPNPAGPVMYQPQVFDFSSAPFQKEQYNVVPQYDGYEIGTKHG